MSKTLARREREEKKEKESKSIPENINFKSCVVSVILHAISQVYFTVYSLHPLELVPA